MWPFFNFQKTLEDLARTVKRNEEEVLRGQADKILIILMR
jgi:hypothetical protein